MNAFLKEEVDFQEMPTDLVKCWKQNSKVNVSGNAATKTVTRTCKMLDGSEKVLTKTLNKVFEI